MQPSFTYSDLQKRFCEGFTFFPIKGLEQSGTNIYKPYTAKDDMREIFGQNKCSQHSGSLHARVLLIKLLQKDIPAGRELISRIRSESAYLEASMQNRNEPAVYRQLLETIGTYYRVLKAYQEQVQEQLAAQIAALCNEKGSTLIGTGILNNIPQIGDMVQEFLRSSDIMYDCLLHCTTQLPGYEKLILTPDEREDLRDLLGMIEAFSCSQEKTLYVVEQWRQECTRYNQMNIMN